MTPEQEDETSIDQLFDEDETEVISEQEQEAPEQAEAEPQPDSEQAEAKEQDAEDSEPDKRSKPDEEEPVMVPISEVHKARNQRNEYAEKTQALMHNMQQMADRLAHFENLFASQQQQQADQNTPETPDPIMDPEGFARHLNETVEQRVNTVDQRFNAQLRQMAAQNSYEYATREHGEDFVKAAIEAADQAGVGQIILQREQRDPVGAAVQWYRSQMALKEIGGDPKAYQEALEAKLRKKFLAELNEKSAAGAARQEIPPSLNSMTNASQAGAPDIDDEDFFNQFMS